jgi:hypothetical protein
MILLYCRPIILYFVRGLRFCVVTMKVCARRFNLYLTALATFALFCGCQTNKHDEKVSALRIHLETKSGAETSDTISVLRSEPITLTVAHEPVLTEADVAAATTIQAQGGLAIRIRFDENATLMLEQITAANPGLHLAIFGQWGEKIANGILTFTPDCSNEEADQFVSGLNNFAKKNNSGTFK